MMTERDQRSRLWRFASALPTLRTLLLLATLATACSDSVAGGPSASTDGATAVDSSAVLDASALVDITVGADQTAVPDTAIPPDATATLDETATLDASIAPDATVPIDATRPIDSTVAIDASHPDLSIAPDLRDLCAGVQCTPDACHTGGVCDPMTGHCSFASKSDGTPCTSGNLCTRGTIIQPAPDTTITIGGFDTARGGAGSLKSGGFLASFRNRLTTTDFPGVTFILTESPTMTPSYLATLDILVLTSPTSNNSAITPLTASEQTTVTAFIRAGGRFLISSDNSTFGGASTEPANSSLLATIGMTSGGMTFNGNQPIQSSVAASPLVTGRSGSWKSVDTNYPGTWGMVGSARVVASVLGDASTPGLAQFNVGDLGAGSARGVVISDVNALSDYGGFNIVMTNNIVDYLIPSVKDVVATPLANTCQAGICVIGAATYCPPVDACHSSSLCDPSSGACATGVAALDGTPCGNGNTCFNGSCGMPL